MRSWKSFSVPDYLRRALRQGLGVGLTVCIGYIIFEPLTGVSDRAADQWLQGCKWAAITIIVVSAPVLGKVTQVSFERTIGTIAGGLLGYVTVILGHKMLEASDVVFTGTMSSLVASGAVVMGWLLGLDYSAKLFVMTFLLVIMGADGMADAFLVALTRISGILLGVLLSLVLSVFVFPKSASHQATDNLGAALDGLITLGQLAWTTNGSREASSHGGLSSPLLEGEQGAKQLQRSRSRLWRASSASSMHKLDPELGEASLLSSQQDPAAAEVQCEKVMMDIYSSLARCDEFLGLSRSERFFTTINGRWCFIPMLPCFPSSRRWQLPRREMADLATSIRKTTRVLWSFRAALSEGFADVVHAMDRRYPAAMMLDLRMHSQAALRDAACGFREAQVTAAQQRNLDAFQQAVQALIALSDHQRQAIIQALVDSQKAESPSTSSSRSPSPTRESKLSSLQPLANMAADSPPDGAALWDMTKVDLFPHDTPGFLAKMRWHAFQFMMQQLDDELHSLHANLCLVLARYPRAEAL